MIPRWVKPLAVVFALFVAAAIAFAVFEPIQVLPRMRLAPGYSLTDQYGDRFTSETARGSVVVYAFRAIDCDGDAEAECARIDETMRTVRDRVRDEVDFGDAGFRVVTIVVDADADADASPAAVRAAAEQASPGDEPWPWITGDRDTLAVVVGSGFRRYLDASGPDRLRFDAGFVIVDPTGVVRGDYRYATVADEADKLVRHLDILSGELRHPGGAAAMAYEAAHLFLCYP